MITALNVDKLRLDMGDYVLSVQSLRKRIGARYVLDAVDVDVKRGAFMALVGPAAAGKTVLLDCIAGARRPSSGRIRYFGYEIKGRPQARVVRMGIAKASQSVQRFGAMTVLETAMLGGLLRHARVVRARAHAREMLVLTGLDEQRETRVDALDESAGRRLGIARAIATDPQILLLDDVWAGLDAAALAHMTTVVAAVREHVKTIVAAARTREHLAPLCDDVVEIDSGITARTELHAALNFPA